MTARKEYLDGCQHFSDMVSSGKEEEASAFFEGDLSTLFHRYDGAAKTLFNFNVRQGNERAEKILKTARYAPVVVAGLTVLVFLFGLLLGMQSAMSGSARTIRLTRQD
jgi:hypothetical protein